MDKTKVEIGVEEIVAEFENDKAAAEQMKKVTTDVVKIGDRFSVAVNIPIVSVYSKWLADCLAVEIEEAISKIATRAASISAGGVESAKKTLRRIQAETAQASVEVDG